MPESKKDIRTEWACRILLTLQLIFIVRGYIVFLQAKYQLVSPLIPENIIYDLSNPHVIASLISGGFMLIALWFYFFNKKIASIVIGGVSFFSEIWMYLWF